MLSIVFLKFSILLLKFLIKYHTEKWSYNCSQKVNNILRIIVPKSINISFKLRSVNYNGFRFHCGYALQDLDWQVNSFFNFSSELPEKAAPPCNRSDSTFYRVLCNCYTDCRDYSMHQHIQCGILDYQTVSFAL